MRVPVIFVLALGVSLACADTIYLKNGHTIRADRARENKGRIEYEIGDNSYAISKSLVERIDTASGPGGTHREEIPAILPKESLSRADELSGKIIRDGRVDPEALAAAEKQGNPEVSAAAYFVAGRFEQRRGNPEKARFYLQRALGFVPDSAVMLEHYVAVLIQVGSYAEAVPYAQQATRLAPNSPDAFTALGLAYFYSGKTKEAIAAWKRSLELRPDDDVRQLLAKAEREFATESDFGEQGSGHFTLHYEGKQSSAAIRREILSTLESHYNQLVREFGVTPRDSISVVLYTEQAFFDVTQAPSWSGALNDGKLRIPIEGVPAMTPELSRVLKHELAHSFVAQITHNRCPTWLNEGVAMALEPQNSAEHGRGLARLFKAQKQVPLNALEGSFVGLSTVFATIAYVESLAAVEYIRNTYGMSDVVRILQRIGEGASTEAALRATIHAGYNQLETEVGDYLKRTYGE